ncbi:MAG: hypothetical protein IJX95_00515 [Lachnospiraceae bacterium]|nr:hypothetical protein [Lachnospiraceae bacterium]
MRERKKLGVWLKEIVEEDTLYPASKYAGILCLVVSMYLCRVITKTTVDEFESLREWIDETNIHFLVETKKELWKKKLRSYWKPVLDAMFYIFSGDEKLKRQKVTSVAHLAEFLNQYEVPLAFCKEDYDNLWEFVTIEAVFDHVTGDLYILDRITKDDGKTIPVVKKPLIMSDCIEEKKTAEIVYYGVERMFVNEENGNRRILMYMPRLHGVFVVDLKYNVKLFMANRYLVGSNFVGDVCSYKMKDTLPVPTELEKEAQIGGFYIDADGKFVTESIPLREGKFDYIGHAMLNVNTFFAGMVIYNCKEEVFEVFLPPDVSIGIIDTVKKSFRLPVETVYKFRRGKTATVDVTEGFYENEKMQAFVPPRDVSSTKDGGKTISKKSVPGCMTEKDDLSFDEFVEFLKEKEEKGGDGSGMG